MATPIHVPGSTLPDCFDLPTCLTSDTSQPKSEAPIDMMVDTETRAIDCSTAAIQPGLQKDPVLMESTGSKEDAKEKKGFILDVFRIPFMSSPKKTAVTCDRSLREAASPPVPPAEDTVPSTPHEYVIIKSQDSQTILRPDPKLAPAPEAHTTASLIGVPTNNTGLVVPEEARPVRSAMSPSKCGGKEAARVVSPHRVSFSPSTEEASEAREHATSEEGKHPFPGSSLPPLDKLNKKVCVQKRKKDNYRSSKPGHPGGPWRALKSHSMSDLMESKHRTSIDSTSSISSTLTESTVTSTANKVAFLDAMANKRRLFRWDKYGIHRGLTKNKDKGGAAKVKVTKHQAVAARHAKTLEQVINAGMGLHPVPLGSSSTSVSSRDGPHLATVAGKKGKPARARPIPMINSSQLKGLKSALLDVNLANSIISELRCMPVPLESLQNGVGRLDPQTKIGTAGDHGQERILTANLPDSALVGPTSKDDSEIRKRTGASIDAMVRSAPSLESVGRPPIDRGSTSAAEEALRKLTLASTGNGSEHTIVTARTSSLPSPSKVPKTINLTKTVIPPSKPGSSGGAKPFKLVCLDCGELEAHQRHAKLIGAEYYASTDRQDSHKSEATAVASISASAVGMISTSAAAALAGFGDLLSPSSNRTSAANAGVEVSDLSNGKLPLSGGGRPSMIRSMSEAVLPILQDGQRLMGSKPLQLLMDPVGTAAETSGAFEVLANFSGAAIRASQDMDTIHPPLDRMAIFVHWWGFELTLPKPTMSYLGTAHSVSGAFLSFLQTMAVGGGVPELLPFIRYISTFMEIEYKAIQAQDMGHGVCIAGTWFMPLALIPRPWDYPLDGPATSPSAAIAGMVSMLPATPGNLREKSKNLAFTNKTQLASTEPVMVAVDTVDNDKRTSQQAVPWKRKISPSQLAAIQAARSEKFAHDLDSAARHSRSSSIASAKSGKGDANAMSPILDPSESSRVALASVQEMPEGSLRIR